MVLCGDGDGSGGGNGGIDHLDEYGKLSEASSALSGSTHWAALSI